MKLYQFWIAMVLILLLMACKNTDVTSTSKMISANTNSSMMEVKCYSGGQVVLTDRTTQLVFTRMPYYISEKTKRKVWLTEGMNCIISEM